MTLLWETAKAAHVGGREEQQDRVEVMASRDGAERLLVLADGMGGHAGGAVAAEAVIEAARYVWHKHTVSPLAPEKLLRSVCEDAHGRINEIDIGSGRSARSTCVVLFANSRRAYWAHVGDSRIYRFRRGKLVERSRDDSVVQMLVESGKIREEDVATHPDQNRLTQSLGGDRQPKLNLGSAKIDSGTGFAMCSDGLWEHVSADELGEALAEPVLSGAAKRLVGHAVERGGAGGDNVSLALARVGKAGLAHGRPSWIALGLVGLAALFVALALVWAIGLESDRVGSPVEGSQQPERTDGAAAKSGR